MSSFKKFILGEKMPDKDDPKYKDRYEKEVNAGMKFAKAAKIDKIAISVQSFANTHRKLFLAIVCLVLPLISTGWPECTVLTKRQQVQLSVKKR